VRPHTVFHDRELIWKESACRWLRKHGMVLLASGCAESDVALAIRSDRSLPILVDRLFVSDDMVDRRCAESQRSACGSSPKLLNQGMSAGSAEPTRGSEAGEAMQGLRPAVANLMG
jgi:hypothetical protein